MILETLEKEEFSQVCTSCEDAFNDREIKTVRAYILQVAEAFLATSVMISFYKFTGELLIALGLFCGYVYFRRQQSEKCPKCNHDSLIPVSTARGKEIMEKHGWKSLS